MLVVWMGRSNCTSKRLPDPEETTNAEEQKELQVLIQSHLVQFRVDMERL